MNKFNKLLSLSLFIIVLISCTAVPTSTPTLTPSPAPTSTPDPYQGTEGFNWWNDTVFYEIFVRSFKDSNGDGIGDFNGITEELDYLQNLGIKGIWLMPINESSAYHGYHITDFFAVESDYGSLDDFKHLLDEAHKRDMKVIMDLVLNHTSDKHPWFQSALQPGSEYHDWYVWQDKDPGTRGPWKQQVWYPAPNGQYYYAVFAREIPDLNYQNPAVREEAKKITSFWLKDVGVDGFRLDGVRYWVEEGNKFADTNANHQFLEEWGGYYRGINPQAFSIGEVWIDNAIVKQYVSTNKELDSAFNFDLSTAIIKSINEGLSTGVRFTIQTTIRDFPEQDNANFITNHDMNRAMSQFGGDTGKAKVAAGILFTAPGIPFVYYGEEIGMTGKRTSGANADIPIRSPMQWSNSNGADFTNGKPWADINPDLATVNVQTETSDPNSLLEFYRSMIQLRNAHSALRVGKTFVADSNSKKLLAYLRSNADETLLVLINIDDKPATDYTLDMAIGPLSGMYTATSLLDQSTIAPLTTNAKGGFDAYTPLAEIPPYTVFVIHLSK